MDIFATATLNGIVRNLKRSQSFLLGTFFPSVSVSTGEEIKFDMENGLRRISPFVSPLREGKVVESLGYTTKTFTPAYIKDKRIFDANRPLKRSAGERIGGGDLTPAQRIQALLVQELGDQQDMLTRRQELMAAEIMRTGKVVITGEGFDDVEVDFGRHADLTDALTGTDEWGDTGVKPLNTLNDKNLVILKQSGASATDVIMDVEAWKLFSADTDVKEQLDLLRANPSANLALAGSVKDAGAQYMGTIGNFNIWLYADWYIDANGTEQPILPSYTVLMGSSAIEGVRHYGAIRDDKAGYQAMEMFAKSWTVEDPSSRLLLMQSAPLVVPYRPNASACITVKA